MMQLVMEFDYNQLDSETRIVVQQRTGEIKTLMKRTVQDIIEIGEKLTEVKAKLPHGKFGEWLRSEFQWGTAQAARFMQVAERFGGDQIYQIDKFAPSALYLLSAPSTPEEARAEAISRATVGERITHQEAKELVAGHRNGNGYHQKPQTAQLIDTRPTYALDPYLDAALEDENKPVCGECGQVYDGSDCPDCRTVTTDDNLPFNYKRDSRQMLDQDIYTPKGMDACQTPAYALDPLLPYLDPFPIIWEPAAGEGHIVEALYDAGWVEDAITQSDILTGQNFFDYEPERWDCLVTNPPFSLKFKWLERCYELGKPFALLLPVETLGTKSAQTLFKKYGIQIILLDKRVNFKMPNKGWDSAAQFPVAWFTWGLRLEHQIIFGSFNGD